MARKPTARVPAWPLIAAGIILYLGLFLRASWRIGDEGSIVYGAQRVTEGALPYRDFFEVIGPGMFYSLALWFTVFGTSWITSRLAVLAAALASAYAIYYITTRQYRGPFEAFPALAYTVLTIPLWPGPSHHFDSNMWMLLAFAVVARREPLDKTTGATAGVLAGIGATFMPQKGALMVTSLVVSTLLNRLLSRRRQPAIAGLVALVGTFGCVGTAVVLFFWFNQALPDLVYATITWPATRYHSVNVLPYAYGLREWALPSWAGMWRALLPSTAALAATTAVALPLVVVATLPVLVALFAVRQAVSARKDPGLNVLPWSYYCAGLALMASELHRPDIMHLIYGSPILLVVVTVYVAKQPWRPGIVLLRGWVACTAVMALLLMIRGLLPRVPVETRRGTVRMVRADDALEFLQRNTARGDFVFVYPYYPMYYFLADVRNPTRYSILLHTMNTSDQFQEVIQALEARQVKFVLWDTYVAGTNLTLWFPWYQDPPYEEQLLERYLEANYRELGVKNRFRVLQRNVVSPPPSTSARPLRLPLSPAPKSEPSANPSSR
ncbi:MAG: hypothetical protein LC753_04240 [Acidobacteria bacterium]|nr:hypothetical protein [Acidobacteriota bacterium]MCA1649508.1 hypothetical protein [Acidobacteriota bacterium]